MKIFTLGASQATAPPSTNLEPSHISETIRARKLKFYRHLDSARALFVNENFLARGVSWVQRL